MEIYIFGLWVKRRKSFRIGKFPNSTVTPWSLLFSAGAGNLGKSLRVIYKRAGCTNPIITRTKTPLNNFSALPIGVISSHDQTWKFSNNLRGHSLWGQEFLTFARKYHRPHTLILQNSICRKIRNFKGILTKRPVFF